MKLNFGWAEEDVRNVLFLQVNPNFTEENNWQIESVLTTTAGDSYSVYNMQTGTFTNYSVSKAEDGTVSFEIVEEEEVEEEEKVEETVVDNTEFEAYKTEQEALAATWAEEKADFESKLETANARIAELETSLNEYSAKEKAEEEVKKTQLIESYTELLPAEALEEVVAGQANFTYEEIESKLAVSYTREMRKEKEKVPAGNFTRKDNPGDELVALLSRYKK